MAKWVLNGCEKRAVDVILPLIIGKLGDIFTIQSVLMVLVCIPVLSLIPIYLIPEVGNHTDEQS